MSEHIARLVDRFVIALDVGGTQIKGGVCAGDGTVLHSKRWLTRAELGPNSLINTILHCADELAALAKRSGRPRGSGMHRGSWNH